MTDTMTIKEQMDVLRKHQNLESVPPVHVVPIAKELGVEVFKARGWPSSLSGMIRKEDSGSYAIYVNAAHGVYRRRFTIAHELAHFMLHKQHIGDGLTEDALYRSGLSNSIEEQANNMAADILMPWSLLDPILNDRESNIGTLAEKFLVSKSAMSIRLRVPFENDEAVA